MKKKKVFKVLTRIFVAILVVILVFSLPLVGVKVSDDFAYISSKFVGTKSKYQGIIEVWNIDTFESGTNSKSKYISAVAEGFQRQNKGLYVLVRDLTEYECMNLLKKGESPDIFSCSYGVASEIQNYVSPFSYSENINILQNMLDAGKVNGELFGLAWCFGFYSFISTDQNLKNARQNIDEEIILSKMALEIGYENKTKKSTKTIFSLTFGTNDYLLPKKAFSSYTNKGLVSNSSYSLDKNVVGQSQYTAYSKMIAGESVILLGTQRDLFRMENRIDNGKVASVFCEPITTFSDLIQFCFIAKTENQIKRELCENFAKFLVLSENQKKLKNIGMLSVCEGVNTFNCDIMSDIIPEKFSIYTPNNIFISKQEISNLQ